MRILQVLPALEQGGVESYVYDCAMRLHHQQQMDILVASNGGVMASCLKSNGILHYDVPLHRRDPWTIWQNAGQLDWIIHHHKINVVHVHSRGPAWSCLRACNARSVPMLSTFHGIHGFSNRAKRLYNTGMLRGCGVIAISDFIEKHLRLTYPTYKDRIILLKEGIDVDRFDPTIINEHQRAQCWKMIATDLGVPLLDCSSRKIALIVGRMGPGKGFDLLLQATAMMAPHHRPIIIAVGAYQAKHPGYVNHLKKVANQLGIMLIHYPSTPDLTTFYAIADVVVAPSIKPEGFGRVMAEALAMEKVVVAAGHGGALELCAKQPTALLHQPQNDESLYRSLYYALTLGEQDIRSIGCQNRRHIRASYSLDTMVRQLADLYTKTK